MGSEMCIRDRVSVGSWVLTRGASVLGLVVSVSSDVLAVAVLVWDASSVSATVDEVEVGGSKLTAAGGPSVLSVVAHPPASTHTSKTMGRSFFIPEKIGFCDIELERYWSPQAAGNTGSSCSIAHTASTVSSSMVPNWN